MGNAALRPVGPNLVDNGDCETGDPPTGWNVSGAGASIAASSDAYAGLQSLEVTAGTTTSYASKTSGTLIAGKKYRLTAYLKSPDAPLCVRLRIINYSGGFSVIKDFSNVCVNEYVKHEYDFIAPYTATVSILIQLYGATPGQTGLIDGVELRQWVNP